VCFLVPRGKLYNIRMLVFSVVFSSCVILMADIIVSFFF